MAARFSQTVVNIDPGVDQQVTYGECAIFFPAFECSFSPPCQFRETKSMLSDLNFLSR